MLSFKQFKESVLVEANSDQFNNSMMDRTRPMSKNTFDARCKALGICTDTNSDNSAKSSKPKGKPKFKKGDAVIFSGRGVKAPKELYIYRSDYNDDMERWEYYMALTAKSTQGSYMGTDKDINLK